MHIKLKKQLGNTLIDVEFSPNKHNVTAIFGQSGAGKTSVINMIAGLITPDEGEIVYGDTTLFSSSKKINQPINKRNIGYVFQDSRLFPNMTVQKNITYGANRNTHNAITTVDEVATLLGISHLMDRYPKMLSGGEKQRVAIARALLSNPAMLLMDEPLASLDRNRRHEMLQYLSNIRSNFNIPIFYVTHSYEEIIRLADDILIIDNGKVKAFGNTVKIINEQNINNDKNFNIYGTVCEGVIKSYNSDTELAIVDFAGGEAEIASDKIEVGTKVRFTINSSDIILSAEKPPIMSVRNVYQGVVKQVVYRNNHFADILVDIGIDVWVKISSQSTKDLQIAENSTIYVLIKSASFSKSINIFR